MNRWGAVDEVFAYRDRLWPESLPELPLGRLLIYFPDAQLSDGAAEAASEGFFDVHNAPPWGSWVAYFEDRASESPYSSYLLAWVPETLVALAAAGIDVNPEQCIVWLDDAPVALREVIPCVLEAG